MKRKMLWLSLGLLVLVLAGCTAEDSPKAGQNAENQNTPGVQVLYYFDNVITRDGKVLFEPQENTDYIILTGRQGQQYYILETVETYDAEKRTRYNEPVLTSCTYRIYDLQGQLLHDLTVSAEGDENNVVRYTFPPDGNLEHFLVIVNQVLVNGTFQILDMEGNVLVEEQVIAPDDVAKWQDGYAWLEQFGNFIQVRCSLYDKDYDTQDITFFYDMAGQPLELARDYIYVYNIYDEFSNESSDYYGGYYENAQGQSMVDLLDKDGQVLVSGLNEISRYADGLFVAVRGFGQGLMDVQGSWLYQESVFKEFEE